MGISAQRLGAALAVTASVSLVLGGCGTKTVEGEEAEEEISESLNQQVGERPGAVECPSQIEAKAGQKARCKLKGSGGSERGVTITMTDDTGRFNYVVDNKLSKPPTAGP